MLPSYCEESVALARSLVELAWMLGVDRRGIVRRHLDSRCSHCCCTYMVGGQEKQGEGISSNI